MKGWLSKPRGLVILDDVGIISHVYFNGVAILDRYGNSYTQGGTVPQIARSGKTPPGAGPFTAANFYSLGTGSDVFDVVNFTCHVVFTAPTITANYQTLFFNLSTTGMAAYIANTSGVGTTWFSGTVHADTANAVVAGVNILSFGRNGATGSIKLNLGTTATVGGANTGGAATVTAKIGKSDTTNQHLATGGIHEVAFTATAFSEATVIAVQQRAKSRLGASAW